MIYYWLILIIIFLILWIFLGGRKYEFIGLKPLFSHEPLPQDPLSINPFIMNHLKGNFTGSFIQKDNTNDISYFVQDEQVQEEENQQGERDRDENKNIGPYYEECSYKSFIQKNTDENKVPFVETTNKRLHPTRDKKRISEVLHMNAPSSIKSKWKYQNLCCKILEDIYKRPFTSSRPSWLKNPETGKILEIDCYNEDLKIGVEYNGIQHYRYPNLFHKTYDDFVKQIRRDQFKHKKCDENGIYLLTVPYNVPQEKIRDYILHYLPENVSRRMENDFNQLCEKDVQVTQLSHQQQEEENHTQYNVPTMTTYQEYLA
jgi:hypothetical protein